MVLGFRVQQVQTGTDVGVGALGDKVDFERVARGGDTVCAGVVSAIESAVSSGSTGRRSNRCVPGVAGVAVCRATVKPLVSSCRIRKPWEYELTRLHAANASSRQEQRYQKQS